MAEDSRCTERARGLAVARRLGLFGCCVTPKEFVIHEPTDWKRNAVRVYAFRGARPSYGSAPGFFGRWRRRVAVQARVQWAFWRGVSRDWSTS